MIAELFTLDRPKLRLVTQADHMGFLADLTTPAQACRAAFLAAEVGALSWDRQRWPDLTFGVWSDAEAPATGGGRRRRAAEADSHAELNTWLHLRPTWPQLGGPSIQWPLPDSPALSDPHGRLEHIAETVHDALNTAFRRTMTMARTLAGTPAQPARPTPNASGKRTFTATGFAAGHAQVGDVLAGLAGEAEAAAAGAHSGEHEGLVAHIGHSITALPDTMQQQQFMVTVTATIHARPRLG